MDNPAIVKTCETCSYSKTTPSGSTVCDNPIHQLVCFQDFTSCWLFDVKKFNKERIVYDED